MCVRCYVVLSFQAIGLSTPPEAWGSWIGPSSAGISEPLPEELPATLVHTLGWSRFWCVYHFRRTARIHLPKVQNEFQRIVTNFEEVRITAFKRIVSAWHFEEKGAITQPLRRLLPRLGSKVLSLQEVPTYESRLGFCPVYRFRYIAKPEG
jgi:hypothetical protein